MNIYKEGVSSITLRGWTFTADADGIIDVPDSYMTSKVWDSGFVSAKARLAALAKQTPVAEVVAEPVVEAEAVAEPAPEPAATATPTPTSKPSTSTSTQAKAKPAAVAGIESGETK
jgi:hypothetical protein